MFLIERLSNNLASRFSSVLKLNKDQEEIIAYGAFNFFQTAWCIFLVILVGIMFNVTIKAVIISFIISILRKYSGGAHSSSPNRCAFIGVITSVGLALIIKYIDNYVNFIGVSITNVIVFIFAYYNIYRYAPVDSPAKPIINEVSKQRMKKKSIFTLNVLATLTIALLIIYFILGVKAYLSTIICICLGILWQVLTLTPNGYLVLLKIDTFLKNLTCRFGGENNEKF